jgi:hypothetical protein
MKHHGAVAAEENFAFKLTRTGCTAEGGKYILRLRAKFSTLESRGVRK